MKQILNHIKKISPIVVALIFSAGIVSAVPYTPPPFAYPTNTDSTVDVGVIDNDKSGGLAVNAFTAAKDSQFNSSVTFSGPIYGVQNPSSNSLIRFGGYDSSATTPITRTTHVASTGAIKTTSGLYSQKTITVVGTKTLCATPAGEVVFCTGDVPAAAVCGNGVVQSGEQCDDGNTINGDGCSSICMDEPKQDLCPDSTNPNPVFAGVQNPLPPGVEIINGLCKVKISGTVQYQCLPGGKGAVKYTFGFDRSIPENLKVNVAYTDNGNLSFNDPDNIFVYPPGTSDQSPPGSVEGFINLTRGMTSYVTPFINLAPGSYQSCWDNYTSYYKTKRIYFKISPLAPDIYVSDFRLVNKPSNNPGLTLENQ